MKKNTLKTHQPPGTIPNTRALAIAPQYYETHKFDKWCEYFLDPKSETNGNATKSALRAYDTKNYNSASRIGHDNTRKLKNLRLAMADQMGYGYGEMMKIGFEKMKQGEFGDWEKMMVRLGHFEPNPDKIAPVQNNYNFNFGNMQEAIAADRKQRGLQP